MFGYIRPVPGELKVREFESFKACYCGLCHMMGEKYGFTARFTLNYELVFLAMLLWEGKPEIDRKRCAASLCRKKARCKGNTALGICAGYCVILAWWKLKDSIADKRSYRKLPYILAALLLTRAYKKAAKEFTEFDNRVREKLRELGELESGGSPSLDRAADKFAQILSTAVPENIPGDKRRMLTELLYHTGRWIYILDAYDDHKEDAAEGRYNPVTARFPPEGGEFAKDVPERLGTTLTHSNNLLCSAFELLPENAWTGIVGNIVYLGMPDTCAKVLSGAWRHTRQRHNFNKDWI